MQWLLEAGKRQTALFTASKNMGTSVSQLPTCVIKKQILPESLWKGTHPHIP